MLTFRYWAAAKAAAGLAEEMVEAGTLALALDLVRAAHGSRLSEVLDRCSFLIDGNPVGSRDYASVSLADGALVDCLPPFAGG